MPTVTDPISEMEMAHTVRGAILIWKGKALKQSSFWTGYGVRKIQVWRAIMNK